MAEHDITPKKEPPAHPTGTDPVIIDPMPPQPKPPIGPSPKQKEILEKEKAKHKRP